MMFLGLWGTGVALSSNCVIGFEIELNLKKNVYQRIIIN